jgi:hypothetical protein
VSFSTFSVISGAITSAPETGKKFTSPEVIAAITGQAGDLCDRWNFLPPGTRTTSLLLSMAVSL